MLDLALLPTSPVHLLPPHADVVEIKHILLPADPLRFKDIYVSQVGTDFGSKQPSGGSQGAALEGGTSVKGGNCGQCWGGLAGHRSGPNTSAGYERHAAQQQQSRQCFSALGSAI
jgi:hypothetical protein